MGDKQLIVRLLRSTIDRSMTSERVTVINSNLSDFNEMSPEECECGEVIPGDLTLTKCDFKGLAGISV